MDFVVTEEKSKGGRPPGPSRRPTIPGFITEAEQAARLGVSISTLRRRQGERGYPQRVKSGRHNLYRAGDDARLLADQLDAAEQAQQSPRGRGRPRLNGARRA